MKMKSISMEQVGMPQLHRILLGAIAPRPIAFASTVDKNGIVNLSPFSFFNAFGVNPTTLIFSPSRRGRDNTLKHTYENIKEIPEVVINVVSFDIVEQMSLASAEYPKGVDEFLKAGLTPIASEKIRPPRVLESPVQFECRVREVIETGDKGGAANLIICEVLQIHLHENILDANGEINNEKINLVGRLGGDLYCHTTGSAAFSIQKPIGKNCIGIDQLPENIRFSKSLTGNELGKMGNLENLPQPAELKAIKIKYPSLDAEMAVNRAKKLLTENQSFEALCLLMAAY